MSVPASTWTDWFSHGSTASDSLLAHSQDPARAIAGAGLLASAFPKGVHDPVQSARNDPGPVYPQRVKALGYALLHAQRLHRHGLRIEAELFEHLCIRKPGCQYSDVDT